MNKKINSEDGGILFRMKEYHLVMAEVLKQRKQTLNEAAADLGISVSTFMKMYRLKGLPRFDTKRGLELKERLEDWSTLSIQELFPEAFFTDAFFKSLKKHEAGLTFRQLMVMKERQVTLTLPASTSTSEPATKTKKKNRKKRTKHKK